MTTTLPPRSRPGASGGADRAARGSRGAGIPDASTTFAARGWSATSVGAWLRSPVAPYYLIAVSAGILSVSFTAAINTSLNVITSPVLSTEEYILLTSDGAFSRVTI